MSYRIFKQLSTRPVFKFIKECVTKLHTSKNNSNFINSASFTCISALEKPPVFIQQQEKDTTINKFFPQLKHNGTTQSHNLISNKIEDKQTIDLDQIIGHKNYYDYGAIKDEQCNISAKQFTDKPLLERTKALLEVQRGVPVPDISLLMQEMQQTFAQKGYSHNDNDNSHITQNIGEQVEMDLIY